jgi:hypothetical protein
MATKQPFVLRNVSNEQFTQNIKADEAQNELIKQCTIRGKYSGTGKPTG